MTKKAKIIILSDDPSLINRLDNGLKCGSYELIISMLAAKGIERTLSELSPDLVILDIDMPSMAGLELSLRIRQLYPVPILMLSTWGAELNKVRGLDLSSESYLTKSLSTDELLDQIEDILSQH